MKLNTLFLALLQVCTFGLLYLRLAGLRGTLGMFLRRLDRIERKERKQTMILDDILTETTRQTTLAGSIKTLIDGLRQQLADAIAAGDTTKQQAILDQLKANDAVLDAVLANTPAAPAPAPAPDAPPTDPAGA